MQIKVVKILFLDLKLFFGKVVSLQMLSFQVVELSQKVRKAQNNCKEDVENKNYRLAYRPKSTQQFFNLFGTDMH